MPGEMAVQSPDYPVQSAIKINSSTRDVQLTSRVVGRPLQGQITGYGGAEGGRHDLHVSALGVVAPHDRAIPFTHAQVQYLHVVSCEDVSKGGLTSQ